MLGAGAADAGRIYAANLFGAATGAILAPIGIHALGSERAILLCSALGAIAALLLSGRRPGLTARASLAIAAAALALLVALPTVFELQPSPYKRLSQLRLDPEARVVATRQDATARLDIVEAGSIHSAPGLSLAYLGPLPRQTGLSRGESLRSRCSYALPSSPERSSAIGHRIWPGADVLLLGLRRDGSPPENGARGLTIVELSPLEPRRLPATAAATGLAGTGSRYPR
jgi:hypothetical protein